MSATAKSNPSNRNRRKRDRWGAERPLEAVGRVGHVTEVAVEPSRFGRIMASIVAALPDYEASGAGRSKANVTRLIIGAIAVVLVTQAKDNITLGVLGALVGLTALFIPIPELRKRRWLASTGRGLTKQVRREVPATIKWDGHKMVIRSNDRGWRSLRPRQTGARVAIGEDGHGQAYLGLVPEHGKRDAAIWFETERSAFEDTFEAFEPTAAFGDGPQTETIKVEGDVFVTLLEALWDGVGKGIPRALNPPKQNSAAAKKKRR